MEADGFQGHTDNGADSDGSSGGGSIANEEAGHDGGRRWSSRARKQVLASLWTCTSHQLSKPSEIPATLIIQCVQKLIC